MTLLGRERDEQVLMRILQDGIATGDLAPQEIAALLSDLCLYGMVARPREKEQGQQRDDATRGMKPP